jgi:pyruvate kinase
MFRRSKIVATVGPACCTRPALRALLDAGVDVFRFNMSHGDPAQMAQWVRDIREYSIEKNWPVAILGDLQGPKIRVGSLADDAMELVAGSEVTITTDDVVGADGLIPTIYAALPQDVKPGDAILLDDGLLELRVLHSEDRNVRCRVAVGGLLKSRKGINLPGVTVSAPAMTDKDRRDLDFCISQEMDWVALSFVRSAQEIVLLKDLISDRGASLGVIAKIEKPEAVDCFDQILEVADGIMVARGDLGVEIRPERVPLIQKEIISKCNEAGKPVITATQMLESMIHNPRPTRAETSDVANAILDGTDAIMLSAETASGSYPLEAVRLMVRVAEDVEKDPRLRQRIFDIFNRAPPPYLLSEAIAKAACTLADTLDAQAILAITEKGNTAALVGKYRPPIPVYAVTASVKVKRRLALHGGVFGLLCEAAGDTEAQIAAVEAAVLESGLLQRDDLVAITMGSPVAAHGTTNLIKMHRLGVTDEP